MRHFCRLLLWFGSLLTGPPESTKYTEFLPFHLPSNPASIQQERKKKATNTNRNVIYSRLVRLWFPPKRFSIFHNGTTDRSTPHRTGPTATTKGQMTHTLMYDFDTRFRSCRSCPGGSVASYKAQQHWKRCHRMEFMKIFWALILVLSAGWPPERVSVLWDPVALVREKDHQNKNSVWG